MIHYSSLVWLLPHLRLKLKFAFKWPKTKAVAICPFYYLVMGFSTFLFQSTASSKVTQLRDVRFNAACCSVIETLYFVYRGHIYSLLVCCSSLFLVQQTTTSSLQFTIIIKHFLRTGAAVMQKWVARIQKRCVNRLAFFKLWSSVAKRAGQHRLHTIWYLQ